VTESTTAPDFVKLLAHDVRWQILTALGHSDYRVQELAALVQQPMNLVSYHLRHLRMSGLVQERRSSADGRDIYCSLDLGKLAHHFQASGAQLHPMLDVAVGGEPPRLQLQPTQVLFLCRRNSARSQMAEGLLRYKKGGRPIEVFSGGSYPTTVHPLAIRAMAELSVDISAHRAKHLDEFRGWLFDYIITVCDQAREECPLFPGDPDCVHWSIADPVEAGGDSEAQFQVFLETAHVLAKRVESLLPILDQRRAAPVDR
jgi:protein-tyrosine-phosphatase